MIRLGLDYCPELRQSYFVDDKSWSQLATRCGTVRVGGEVVLEQYLHKLFNLWWHLVIHV